MGKLNGKVAVLTASTNGIGFAMAKQLGLAGASIVISSRREENVNSAVTQLKNSGIANILGIVCHVSNTNDRAALLSAAIETFGRIDILILNAGVNPIFKLTTLTCPESAWDKIFDVNLKSVFLMTKEIAPYLKKNPTGRIIYLSSIAGVQPRGFSVGAYSVSKTALLGLTKVFAEEFAPHNITVNCIAPGLIRTNFSRVFSDPQHKDHGLLKRAGTPDEVAALALFLCADDAAYITGETIVIAGGMMSRL